jgi:hypothetical protein
MFLSERFCWNVFVGMFLRVVILSEVKDPSTAPISPRRLKLFYHHSIFL